MLDLDSPKSALGRLKSSRGALVLLLVVLASAAVQLGLQAKGYVLHVNEFRILSRAVALSQASVNSPLASPDTVNPTTSVTSSSAASATASPANLSPAQATETITVIVEQPTATRGRSQQPGRTVTVDFDDNSAARQRLRASASARPTGRVSLAAAGDGKMRRHRRRGHAGGAVAGLEKRQAAAAQEVVTQECGASIGWAKEVMARSMRQDIAVIVFFLWLSGLVVVGLIRQSVPHLIVLAASSALAGALVILQIVETLALRKRFRDDLAGPCSASPSLATTYWDERLRFEIASAVLEWVATGVITFLLVRIRKELNWQTFKSIGASRQAARAHRLGLVFQVLLQMSVYFIVTFNGLWINELLNTTWNVASIELKPGFIGFLVTLTALALPWLVLGWRALGRRSYRAMAAFLFGDLIYIGLGLFLLADPSALLSKASVNWVFLRFLGVSAALLLIANFVIGLACLATFRALPIDADEEFTSSEKAPPGFVIDFPTSVRPASDWLERDDGDSDASSVYSKRPEIDAPALPPLYIHYNEDLAAAAVPSRWSDTTRTTDLSGQMLSTPPLGASRPRVLC